jgi:hypothetical protein
MKYVFLILISLVVQSSMAQSLFPRTEFDFVVKGSSSWIIANGAPGNNRARSGYRNSIGGGVEFWRVFQIQTGYSHLYKVAKNIDPKEIGFPQYGLMYHRSHEHNIYLAGSLRFPIPGTAYGGWVYGEARYDFTFSRRNTSYGSSPSGDFRDATIPIPLYNQAYVGLGIEVYIFEEIVLNFLGYRMASGTLFSKTPYDAFEGVGLEVGIYYRFLD